LSQFYFSVRFCFKKEGGVHKIFKARPRAAILVSSKDQQFSSPSNPDFLKIVWINLQRVEGAIFGLEIVDVRFDGQRGTAGAFDDFRGCEFAAMAINILT